MRILWLAHRDPMNPRAGGAERTIVEVCTRLVKRGHEVILLSGGWENSKSVEYFNGIEINRFGNNIGPHLALPILLIKYNYDIVVNDLGHAIPWVFSTVLNKRNIVFFHHLHARSLPGQINYVMAKLITAIERCYFIIYHNSRVVTESTTSKNDLIKLGIKENKIITIPPGVDQSLFHPTVKSNNPTLVYYGGMRKYKRPLEVLYLLKSLLGKFDNLKLFIIGNGPEEENMKRLTNKLNVQNYVEFMGRLSTNELAEIVASSWINIHTSITEGWGFSILEAASAGTPTVAFDVPGVRDAVEEGQNGIKVEDGNREALAEAAYKILINPEKWFLSSIKIAKKYSWDKTAELWEYMGKEMLKVS